MEFSFSLLVTWFSMAFMVFGGVLPYIPQYLDIRKSSNADGFSTFVCLALLIANILRIFFWVGKQFELPLLLQSILMTVAMILLMELCIRIKNKTEVQTRQRHFSDFKFKDFWRWSDFESYVQFLLLFSLIIGVITFSLKKYPVYVETLGFAAVATEALLGVPQFYKNWSNHSTEGMSQKMVFMWTVGDIYKTCYFVLRKVPAQFWICGAFQISLDFAIFLQVFCYGKGKQG